MSVRKPFVMTRLASALVVVLLTLLGAAGGNAHAQCGGRWLTSPQQVAPGFDGPVYAYAVMPNGDVVAGGSFGSVGGVPVSSIARWNGTTWSAMGDIGRVNALALDQNGDLIAGAGDDSNSGFGAVYRWNGSSWSQIGGDTGFSGGVMAVAIAPGGDILAGGWFTGIGYVGGGGGTQASCIARWNGSTWSALGSPVPPNFPIPGLANPINTSPAVVHAITVLASGDVVAGGRFLSATNADRPIPVQNVARWNGSAWSALGPGLRGGVNTVRALGVLSNGQIVAAGGFSSGSVGPYSNIATWNGTSWVPIGTGLEDPSAGSTTIYALKTLANGGVIIGGDFGEWDGRNANRVARWNGSSWSAYDSGVDNAVFALTLRSNGDVLLGGAFSAASGAAANRAASWNGSQWAPVASGLGLSDAPAAMVTMPNGDIIAAGPFTAVNGAAINVAGDGAVRPGGVARWNGAAWSPLPPLAPVNALVVASNSDLIAGGSFGNGVLRLSGSTWAPLAGGGVDGPVNAMVRMPNGDIVVGGNFLNAAGVPAANRIARWNGSSWAPLGTGLNGSVSALAVLPNGDLVAAGAFSTAGGAPANRVARWNGAAWSPMGSGIGSGAVLGLAVRPNGDLIAGGQSLPFGALARWTGAAWSSIGAEDMFRVQALTVRANGDVIAGGLFDSAGGVPARNIASWNGSAWTPLGAGLDGIPSALAVSPSGEIIAGGALSFAGGAASNYLARWTDAGTPWAAVNPLSQSIAGGQTLTLSATCAAGYDFGGAVSVQWLRDGSPIVDGPGGASHGGGTVNGAAGSLSPSDATSVLNITGARPGDGGAYTAVFSNACGSAPSTAATVTVACPADFNLDGFVDFFDYADYVGCFETGSCPPDTSADFNRDGFADFFDYSDFVAAFETGC